MPDINFRLTATDEATPVIDRLRRKMDGMNRPGASSGGSARSSGGSSGNAGTGGFLGSGKIGGVAGITIIAQAALQALQKINQRLMEASPYLASINQQFKTATDIYLRPMGDAIARMLQPASERALEKAEERSELFEQMEQDWGPVATVLATVGFALYDVKAALWEFNYGVWNALSKVYLWPMDKLGDLLGVDLPGSLTELLDQVFGIKGGFSGIQDWLEGIPGSLAEGFKSVGQEMRDTATHLVNAIAGFGPWLWEKITTFVGDPLGTLADLGSWLWGKITSIISSPMSTLAGFSSWLYNKLKDVLGKVPAEAYKAFHNAVASLLNSISNIELPLVGKPFKGLFGTIPMLASGGIVTQPTLAMIGERGAEAVIPLNKAGQLGMGQGMNVTLQINAPIYGVEDLERTFRDMMSREQLGYSGYR